MSASTTDEIKSILVRESHLQILTCRGCGQVHEYGWSTAAHPEAMALLVERLTDDHNDCLQWLHDPARARRERRTKLRMRREFRKLQCGRRLF